MAVGHSEFVLATLGKLNTRFVVGVTAAPPPVGCCRGSWLLEGVFGYCAGCWNPPGLIPGGPGVAPVIS